MPVGFHGLPGEPLAEMPVAGSAGGQRWTWTQSIAAGASAELLDIRHDAASDMVLHYASATSSTETATIQVDSRAPHAELQTTVDVAPGGGGSLRVGGAVSVSAFVDNAIGGTAEIIVWMARSALVEDLPPIQATATINGGSNAFLSPSGTGYPPAGRPFVYVATTQVFALQWVDALGVTVGTSHYNPNIQNRELRLVHPPKCRLRVTNNGGVSGQIVVTWHRS